MFYKMSKEKKQKSPKKCYNTFSCIASVVIIIFMVGAVLWDLLVSKPVIYNSIEEIRVEVQHINKKIDDHYRGMQVIDSIRAVNHSVQNPNDTTPVLTF